VRVIGIRCRPLVTAACLNMTILTTLIALDWFTTPATMVSTPTMSMHATTLAKSPSIPATITTLISTTITILVTLVTTTLMLVKDMFLLDRLAVTHVQVEQTNSKGLHLLISTLHD
jgi:hypothetical protein